MAYELFTTETLDIWKEIVRVGLTGFDQRKAFEGLIQVENELGIGDMLGLTKNTTKIENEMRDAFSGFVNNLNDPVLFENYVLSDELKGKFTKASARTLLGTLSALYPKLSVDNKDIIRLSVTELCMALFPHLFTQ